MSFINKKYLIFIALFILIIISHQGSLSGTFIWDDIIFFIHNPLKLGSGLKAFKYYFTNSYFSSPDLPVEQVRGYYRPLANILYSFFSVSTGNDPFFLHFINYCLHFINSLLICSLLALLGYPAVVVCAVSSLFALHPAFHQVIDYVTGMVDLWAAFFSLSMLLSYISYIRNERKDKVLYCFSIIMFALSCLTKENAFFMPLVLIFISIIYLKVSLFNIFKHILPYAVVLIINLYIRKVYINAVSPSCEVIWSLSGYMQYLYFLFCYNITQIIIPLKTTFMEQYFFYDECQGIVFTLRIFVGTLFSLISIYCSKTRKLFFLFLILYLPVSNIIPLHPEMLSLGFYHGDHLLYIPAIAVLTILVILFRELAAKLPVTKEILTGLFIIVLFFLAIKTRENSSVWGDPVILYNRVINDNPNNTGAYTNLGIYYFERKEYNRAYDIFSELDKLLKGSGKKHELSKNKGNMGYTLLLMGKHNEALEKFREAIKIFPGNNLAKQGIEQMAQKGLMKDIK